jgi:hypothetical protein
VPAVMLDVEAVSLTKWMSHCVIRCMVITESV